MQQQRPCLMWFVRNPQKSTNLLGKTGQCSVVQPTEIFHTKQNPGQELPGIEAQIPGLGCDAVLSVFLFQLFDAVNFPQITRMFTIYSLSWLHSLLVSGCRLLLGPFPKWGQFQQSTEKTEPSLTA